MTHSDSPILAAPLGDPSPGQYESGSDFRDHLRRIWAYKWLIGLVFLLGVGTTWLMVQQIVPRYTATAVLMVEPPEKNVIELESVVEGLDTGVMTLRGEIEVLRSRGLASKAVKKLVLKDSQWPDRRREAKSPFTQLNPLSYIPADWKRSVDEFWRATAASLLGRPRENGSAMSEPAIDQQMQTRHNILVGRFLSGLQVSRDQYSKIFRISFTFENSKLAAESANALADAYVENTLEVKYAGTREAAEWLDNQLKQLRLDVEESEAAVERIRQGEALVQGRNSELVSRRISAINDQLHRARIDTARLRARTQQLEELRNAPDTSAEGGNIIGSGLIQTLHLEQFRLEREEADLALELGDKHPRMINTRTEIANIAAKLERELDNYVEAARSELTVARAHEASLKQNLESMTNQVGDLNDAEIQLRALEREAKANRDLYESFLTRSKQARAQEDIQQPDARVISYAQVPFAPSYPPKQKYINTAIVVSLGIALVLVFFLEKLDKSFRTTKQVEQQTGLTVVGVVPSVRVSRENVKEPADLITKDSQSRFTESINMIYSRLKWPREGGIQKTVLLTSALPKEGKTSVSIALARRAAYLGDKVVLVDADFRNPIATRKLGLRRSPGIGELLSNGAKFDDVLQRDKASGAFILSGGKTREDPIALIGSEKFRNLIEKLRETFDLVLFDSSPVLAVAEPLVLSRVVDQTIVLIRWGKTPRQAALTAVKQLEDFSAKDVGIVLNRVNLTQQSYYGYGEYGYYSGKMKGYYSS